MNLKRLIIALVAVAVLAGFGMAQDKVMTEYVKTPSENITITPGGTSRTEPSLELSAPEKEFLKQLSLKLQPTQVGLQATWDRLLVTEDEKEAVNLWLRARLLNIKALEVRKEFTEWFEKIKLLHKCPECDLKDDRLVRPEPKKESLKP